MRLYTDSTVALDPDTGKLVWYYQHMNRDVWDLDWVFEQTLLTLPVNGKPTKLVVTGGKIAIFDAINRATGKYAFSKDLGLQKLVSSHRSQDRQEDHQSGIRSPKPARGISSARTRAAAATGRRRRTIRKRTCSIRSR